MSSLKVYALIMPIVATCLLGGMAEASVVVVGTRVIYPAAEREITVQLKNNGEHPALVQAWIDGGDPNISPSEAKSPFLVTPPLVRINPRKGQALRIAYMHDPLPNDRESVFWLNVLDIPPSAKKNEEGQNKIQVAIRTRLKIFFRPDGLKGNAGGSAENLDWELVSSRSGNVIRAINSSPFHVTIADVKLVVNGKSARNTVGGMIPPFGSYDFPVSGSIDANFNKGEIGFRWVSDFGGIFELKKVLNTDGAKVD